jgi:hypothetical protein
MAIVMDSLKKMGLEKLMGFLMPMDSKMVMYLKIH